MARLRDGVGGTLVLDAEGLVKLANDDLAAMSRVKRANSRNAAIVTAATTLTEVLRGGPRDARLHRVLRKVKVVSIYPEQARAAGELLGRTGLSGHRCALDALLAEVAGVVVEFRRSAATPADRGSRIAFQPFRWGIFGMWRHGPNHGVPGLAGASKGRRRAVLAVWRCFVLKESHRAC